MRRRVIPRWLAAPVLGSLLIGCQAVQGPYAEEPLLLSKRPVEGKIGAKREPTQVASIEPKAPPLPETALAVAPKLPPAQLGPPTGPALRPSEAVANTPAMPPDHVADRTRRKAPVTATPAVRTKSPAETPASPTARPRVESPAGPAAPPLSGTQAPGVPAAPPRIQGNYGHNADYTWLQGVLDHHYHGHVYLRYCDPTVEDIWGGKVCFDGDPRLAQFHAGDVVRVEGAIVPEADPTRSQSWKHYPRYRIQKIERVP